jgi:hypothetical protein
MLSDAQLVALRAAAIADEYIVEREYNGSWGDDCKVLKELELMGLMKFMTYERNPLTKAFCRKSKITDAGTSAWQKATTKAP